MSIICIFMINAQSVFHFQTHIKKGPRVFHARIKDNFYKFDFSFMYCISPTNLLVIWYYPVPFSCHKNKNVPRSCSILRWMNIIHAFSVKILKRKSFFWNTVLSSCISWQVEKRQLVPGLVFYCLFEYQIDLITATFLSLSPIPLWAKCDKVVHIIWYLDWIYHYRILNWPENYFRSKWETENLYSSYKREGNRK